tara:strand:- start:512 stop:1237 length:726 start_codon:yes stop_codon:yes gene_type:complete
MASMTVLSIIQRFAYAVGIPSPSTAYVNQSADVQQMVELLNQEGRSLSRRHNWQALTFEASFTTVATESQGTLATIIGATQELRGIVNSTIWNRSTQMLIWGPLSNQTWQAQKALGLTGPYSQYRIRGNTLRFDPAPTAGETCYFEYISNCWCTDTTGATYRRNVAADTDLMLLSDEIMLAGLEWRWLRKKGLSYAEEFATYEQMVSDAMSRDGTKRTLHMDGGIERRTPGIIVPQGSWPL